MRRNSTTMGALHPILFFLCVYGISLFLAIFVCRTVYYSMNANAADAKDVKASSYATAMAATVLR